MIPRASMIFWGSLLLCASTLVSGIRVFFDADGCYLSFSDKVVKVGEAYGELPVVNETGYEFEGWYSEKDGGDKIVNTTIVTQKYDHYIYAHLVPKTIIVLFDPMGGYVENISKEVLYKNQYGTLPEPKRESDKFIGWRTLDNAVVTNKTIVVNLKHHILKAAWGNNTVSFIIGNGTVLSAVVRYDEDIVYPTDPERDGYTFKGWDRKVAMTDGMDVKIIALWSENGSPQKQKGNEVTIALGIVFTVVLIGIIALLSVVLFRMMRKDTLKYERRELKYEDEEDDEEDDPDERTSGNPQGLYKPKADYGRRRSGYERDSKRSGYGDDDDDDEDNEDGEKGGRSYARKGGRRGRELNYNRSQNYDRKRSGSDSESESESDDD